MSLSDFFREHHIKRAAKRRHRPCPKHGPMRVVCSECAKVYCPKCRDHPCLFVGTTAKPKRTRDTYIPTKELKPVWSLFESLEPIGIESHGDADAWKILFKPNTLNTQDAADLADKLWNRDDFQALATSTPFRAGRGNNPPHWWVSFMLKVQNAGTG
jgi:hypothetical protein